jgi:hypothetical protein
MLLYSLLLIPIIGISWIYTTTSDLPENHPGHILYSKRIALATSIINLILSLVIYISFDFSSNQFQLVEEHYDVTYFDIYLGIDGLSIYFVVRPLIITELAPLRAVIELVLRKPINLPEVEITRGQEHVNKVSKDVKCKYPRGKVIYIHAQIIMPLQKYNLTSKTFDTKCNHKCVEKQIACFSSWLLIRERFLKHWAKDIISDSVLRTGDLLSLVIGIRILTWMASISGSAFKGDGVTIVLFLNQKEGLQETVFNKNRTSIGQTIHSIPLRTKTFDYNSMLARHSLVRVRHFSATPLAATIKGGETFNKGVSKVPSMAGLSVQIKKSINPWFITGFTDAEGCFMVNVLKLPKLRVGWRVQPVFQIGLHSRDEELLNNIQKYFCGYGFMTKLTKSSIIFRISSLEQLDKVLEHFEQYPLQSKKYADYCLFKEVIIKMKRGEHLTAEGLLDIVKLKASLNNGLTPLLKESFPNCIPAPRPIVENPHKPDPNWVAGFTSGEGCFTIYISKSSAYKTGFSVNLRFQISQHTRDEVLMRSFIDYFGCGQYYFLKAGQLRGDFVVTRLPDIMNKIKPFFTKYPILGVKSQDFDIWCKAIELMSKKEHLKIEGVEKMRQFKDSINSPKLCIPPSKD